MKAFKVFDENWMCKEFQYEIGKTYKLEENGKLIEPRMCKNGFHACIKVNHCFSYYNFDTKNKIAEVELEGTILGLEEDKQCANIITILKEVSWSEMLSLANLGFGCSGHSNSGYWNSGNWNSGNSNSGNCNSGYWNSGNWNSGNSNSGNSNSGDRNSGNSNSGNSNSGNSNSGDRNSGNSNSGDRNSGNSNSGDRNSGNWNSGDRNGGFFNTDTPQKILVFDKMCDMEEWINARKPEIIFFNLTEWVKLKKMTDQEKIDHPNAHVCDGYLKIKDYKQAWKEAFKNASEEDIKLLKALPNFNAKKFEIISGIKL